MRNGSYGRGVAMATVLSGGAPWGSRDIVNRGECRLLGIGWVAIGDPHRVPAAPHPQGVDSRGWEARGHGHVARSGLIYSRGCAWTGAGDRGDGMALPPYADISAEERIVHADFRIEVSCALLDSSSKPIFGRRRAPLRSSAAGPILPPRPFLPASFRGLHPPARAISHRLSHRVAGSVCYGFGSIS